MKKLTKRDEERRAEIMAALEITDKALTDAIEEVNVVIREKLSPAIEAYNEKLADAEALKDDIVAAIDEYIDGRSDKWREGDAAQAFEGWKSEWENFDTTALDAVAEIEIDDRTHRDDLDGLPSEPNE